MNRRNNLFISLAAYMLLMAVSLLVNYRWPQYKPLYYAVSAIAAAILLTWLIIAYTRKKGDHDRKREW